MKTIAKFKIKDEFENKVNYAEVAYSEKQCLYYLFYKYSTMKEEKFYMYKDKNLAMYDFHKRIMFLLS